MATLFSAQNSWMRYFTELSTGSIASSDGSHATTKVDGADTESGMDFEVVLQRTITEYGATKDHMEILEKKLTKMLEIKEAKARSDFEIAKKNYALSEKETTLIKQILGREPDIEPKDWEDDDATIKAGIRRREDNRSITPDTLAKDKERELPTVIITAEAEKRAESILQEYEQVKQQLAYEQHLREEAEKSLAASEAQNKVDVAHVKIMLKNEEVARKSEEAARVKADRIAAEETRARYAAEQEVQRLRTQIKLISRDKKQSLGVAPGSASVDNVFSTTHITESNAHLVPDGKGHEGQVDLQDPNAKAEKKRSGLGDSIKKKKLSKRLRASSLSFGGGGYDGVPSTEHPVPNLDKQ